MGACKVIPGPIRRFLISFRALEFHFSWFWEVILFYPSRDRAPGCSVDSMNGKDAKQEGGKCSISVYSGIYSSSDACLPPKKSSGESVLFSGLVNFLW